MRIEETKVSKQLKHGKCENPLPMGMYNYSEVFDIYFSDLQAVRLAVMKLNQEITTHVLHIDM